MLFCFGGVRGGQSFVFFNCCFVLVGLVLGNLLFWWGSCWAIFCFGGFVLGNLLFWWVRVGQSFVLVGFVLGNLLFSVQCFVDRCLYCVLFLLAIILSVILRLTASDNRFDIFKLFLLQS